MRVLLQLLVIAATVAAGAIDARAGLVSVNDPTYGAGSITLDTDTNLEWLDLTHTVGQSVSFVQSQLGPGGLYEGFSVATSNDLETLVTNGGWTFRYNWNFTNDPSKYAIALDLVELLGKTFSTSEPRDTAYGFVSDTNPANGDYYYDGIFSRNSPSGPYTASVFVDTFSNPSPVENIGVWLHRQSAAAVPEPSSMVLIGLGGLGLIAARKRRQAA